MLKKAVIIPCYNEAKRLKISELTSLLSEGKDMNIYFVDDASNDSTNSILKEFCAQFPDTAFLISVSERSGKAEAVRKGVVEALKKEDINYVGFLDADLSVSVTEFIRLCKLIELRNHAFITGSRIKKIGNKIVRNEWRHFYSRIIATLVGFITKLEVYDTQCGAKVFNKQLASDVFNKPFRTNWLFDVELFHRIQKSLGDLGSFGTEEPLKLWIEKKSSKLRWFHLFGILKELLILHRHCRPSK